MCDLGVQLLAQGESSKSDSGFDDWWRCIEVNLGGALAAAGAVLPGMWERGRGRIVHMNSLASGSNRGPNLVSKAGLHRLRGVLAAMGAERGIAVFDVSPGLVHTAMTDHGGFANLPEDEWSPISKIAGLVRRIASGELDRLAGRFHPCRRRHRFSSPQRRRDHC